MKDRMRVRTPASNGSNQSAPRKSSVSAAPATCDVVSVVMASSPLALQRRSWLAEQAGDYAALTFQPPPRRHLRSAERTTIGFMDKLRPPPSRMGHHIRAPELRTSR